MKLAHCLNRTLHVSIPAFFGDDESRACILADIEPAGLWLECDALKDRVPAVKEITRALPSTVTAFFPFSQILYVLDPSQFAVLAIGGRLPTRPGPASHALPQPAVREGPQREKRP